ncbi:MAG: SDR family oxidoreductase, partial [Bacteroidetes bacterium]|nr:SDR family oxidoreductase [Bacteroidota bacterium]
MTPKKGFAVITGASQGIGAAIARGFAESVSDLDLALVARNTDRLET